jgi:hypothetical protein
MEIIIHWCFQFSDEGCKERRGIEEIEEIEEIARDGKSC